MSHPSLQIKKAYFARVRHSNYIASLRLAGFQVTPADVERPLPSRFHTPGQMTHILRHTFASHYMMGGGDILGLQRILGHSTITMTMRYAHLSPDHLESALRLSPLNQSRHAVVCV